MSEIRKYIIILLLLTGGSFVFAQSDSVLMRKDDKLRIREARNMMTYFGDSVWHNWSSTPFAILLVADAREYLMFHPNPSDDFYSAGYDTILGENVYARKKQFSENFLATFPAVNGIPTIVVGIPENTKLSGPEWIITLLHEHFHQLQFSNPDYYDEVNALELAGTDNTGMWMINYKFPYEDNTVSDQYTRLVQSAKAAYLSIGTPDFDNALSDYLNQRQVFKSLLSENDYRYFSFQIWQEGIARYTEVRLADYLKDKFKTSMEASQLEDYVIMDSLYSSIRSKLLKNADTQVLSDEKRICFYTLGGLEGLILDETNPEWKDDYFTKKFFIEEYYK